MLIHYRVNPVMHWYSIQGGIEIFLVTSCYRNRSDGHWLVLSYKFKVGYNNAFHRHKVMMLSNCHCGLLFAFKAVQMFISCCLDHFCRWGSWAWCVFCQRCFLFSSVCRESRWKSLHVPCLGPGRSILHRTLHYGCTSA